MKGDPILIVMGLLALMFLVTAGVALGVRMRKPVVTESLLETDPNALILCPGCNERHKMMWVGWTADGRMRCIVQCVSITEIVAWLKTDDGPHGQDRAQS